MMDRAYNPDNLLKIQSEEESPDFINKIDSEEVEQLNDSDEEYYYDLADIKDTSSSSIRKLVIVSLICLLFMAAEIVGGIISDSIAILADAAHLLSDISGFIISIISLYIGKRPASKVLSFGYHRAEVIGALASVILIWALTGILVYLAILRCVQPETVNGEIMFITSCLGLFCNIGNN